MPPQSHRYRWHTVKPLRPCFLAGAYIRVMYQHQETLWLVRSYSYRVLSPILNSLLNCNTFHFASLAFFLVGTAFRWYCPGNTVRKDDKAVRLSIFYLHTDLSTSTYVRSRAADLSIELYRSALYICFVCYLPHTLSIDNSRRHCCTKEAPLFYQQHQGSCPSQRKSYARRAKTKNVGINNRCVFLL